MLKLTKSGLVTGSYLLGSIPFSWIFAKMLKGVDLRQTGSGGTGATNAARVIGLPWAVVAGTLDVLKAFFPTRLAIRRHPNDHLFHLLVAAAAMLGHSRPIFLGFRGGKAVTPLAGDFFAIAALERKLWDVFKLAIGVFLGAIIGSGGKVSVGSISGSTAGGVYALELARQRKVSIWYAVGLAIAAAYIWLMHKENVGRLLRGEEPNTGREILEKIIQLVVRMLGRGHQ